MPPAMLGQKHLRRDNKTLILDIIGLQRYSFYSEYQIVRLFFFFFIQNFQQQRQSFREFDSLREF